MPSTLDQDLLQDEQWGPIIETGSEILRDRLRDAGETRVEWELIDEPLPHLRVRLTDEGISVERDLPAELVQLAERERILGIFLSQLCASLLRKQSQSILKALMESRSEE